MIPVGRIALSFLPLLLALPSFAQAGSFEDSAAFAGRDSLPLPAAAAVEPESDSAGDTAPAIGAATDTAALVSDSVSLQVPPKAAGEVFSLSTVVVKGRRRPRADSQTRSEPMQVIDAAELRGRSTSIEEVLTHAAGVKVRQSGGVGSESKLSIHGLEGNRVLILLDGYPLESESGNLGINDIPIDFIERIEIYKGYVPARFGGDGLAGAVNIVTREFNRNYVEGSISPASHGTLWGNMLVKHNFEGPGNGLIEVGGAVIYNSSDNDYTIRSPYVDTLMIKRDHDRFSSTLASGGVTLKRYWFDEVEFEGAWFKSHQQIQGISHAILQARTTAESYALALKPEKKDFFVEGLDFKAQSRLVWQEGRTIDTSSVRCLGWNLDNCQENEGPRGEVGEYPVLSSTVRKQMRQTLDLDYRIARGTDVNWTTVAGYETHRASDSLGSTYAGYDVSGQPGSLGSVVSGLTLETELLGGRLLQLAGIKYYRYSSEATANVQSLTAQESQSRERNTWGWSEDVRLHIVDSLSLKLGYQLARRSPTSIELFGDGISVHSSPNLIPETSHNFHAGLLFEAPKLPLLNRASWELNGFLMQVQDMILLQQSGAMGCAYYNLEAIRIQGFDTEIKLGFFDDLLNLKGNLTFQDLRNTTELVSQGVSKGHIVPNVPRFFANTDVELRRPALLRKDDEARLYWNLAFVDDYYYNWKVSSRQDRTIPGSLTHDVGAEYALFNRRLSFSAEARNLTDEDVWDEYLRPKAGRTFAAKVRFSFES
jgi:outer membrane cobalamin receptor